MYASKCHICGKEATTWSGRYIMPADIVTPKIRTQCVVGVGFCTEHRSVKCPNEFNLVGCFGVWDPKYGIKPHSGVGKKSKYHDILISKCDHNV